MVAFCALLTANYMFFFDLVESVLWREEHAIVALSKLNNTHSRLLVKYGRQPLQLVF